MRCIGGVKLAESVEHFPSIRRRDMERRVSAAGARFALKNLSTAVSLAFFPAIVRAGVGLWQNSQPLRPNGLFVVFIALAFAFAWQLTATTYFLVGRLREETVRKRVGDYISSGLSSCPKVFLSYALLFGMISLSSLGALTGSEINGGVRGFVVSTVFFSIFLIWAPAFVAGENFAEQPAKKDEDEFDPYEEEDSEDFAAKYFPKFFTGMGIVDIGIDRSIQFTIRNFAFSLQVLLIMWCVDVIPQALGILLFGKSTDVATILFEALASSAALGVTQLYVGYTFLLLLPEPARSELNVLGKTSEEPAPRPFLIRTIIGMLVLTSFIATGYLFQSLRVEQSFPAELKPKNVVINVHAGTLSTSFELDDNSLRYRWFHPSRFALKVAQTPALPVDEALPKKGGLMEIIQGEKEEHKFLAPSDTIIRDEYGEILDERFFSPHTGKIRVELKFDIVNQELKGSSLVYSLFAGEKALEDEPYTVFPLTAENL